jgi:hypothetical protein
MKKDLWQLETLNRITELLQSFETVQAMILVGSFANNVVQPDFWSDLDLIVVVADEAVHQFYLNADWLYPVAPVFATSQSKNTSRYTLRVCFEDMRRLDLIFIPASAFETSMGWNDHPFSNGFRVLFSRSSVVEDFLSNRLHHIQPEIHNPEAQFLSMSNDFWFKGMLAVYKVVRRDLLIAYHLTLDLARDCLVLKMMLRDRETGTRFHRTGGQGNDFGTIRNLHEGEISPAGILTMLEKYSQFYDHLAKEWATDYQEKRFPLIDWIRKARESLALAEI